MRSEETQKFVRGNWSSWKSLSTENLSHIPDKKGIYIIRAIREIPRLTGLSDILYVGQGNLKNRLGKCLNYKLHYSSWPYESGRIYRVEKELNLPMEFSYLIMNSSQQAETAILDEYEKQHIELPPLNLTRGRSSSLPY